MIEHMMKPIFVEPRANYRIFIRYVDGAAGEVDLSDFANKGVFRAWADPKFFSQVHIGTSRQIRWNDDVELCPDSVYLKLTGQTPEQFLSTPLHETSHA